jgi:hypothetical protein
MKVPAAPKAIPKKVRKPAANPSSRPTRNAKPPVIANTDPPVKRFNFDFENIKTTQAARTL